MEKKLNFHPEAEKEFIESYHWHEKNRPNSGKEFLSSVDKKLKQIEKNPEARSSDNDGVRWASVSNKIKKQGTNYVTARKQNNESRFIRRFCF